MLSTFHGLEVARRGMNTQRAALATTGHNIANANTPGYTRQRVNFEQTEPYPPASMNRPNIPGQMGTGVKAGEVQRVRESFLDDQYRLENNKHGYWEAKNEALSRLEDVMNEPSEDGLAQTMDKFWNSLQDLSVQPEDSGARSVVRQRGIALADTLNYLHDSLKANQEDYGSQIEVAEKAVNSILRQINNVNKQVSEIEPHGYTANDLYDERDRLIDELSQYMNVRVERVKSDGLPAKTAEGMYNIYLTDGKGVDVGGIKLVDGENLQNLELKINKTDPNEPDSPITTISFEGPSGSAIPAEQFQSPGKLKAYIETYGYESNGEIKGTFPEMMDDLDTLTHTFVQEFNMVHRTGWSITELDSGSKEDFDFFDYEGGPLEGPEGAASKIKIADVIYEKLDNIAASSSATVLSEKMKAGDDNDPTSVGAPLVRGIFQGVEVTDPDPQSTTDISINLTFNGTGWDYQLVDNSPNGIQDDNMPSGTIEGQSVTLENGLTIDISDVAKATDGDAFTFVVNEVGIKASNESYVGDGSNASALSEVKDTILDYGGSKTNVQSFYQGVIGDMGVNAEEASRMSRNSETLRGSVDQRRQSVSSVSIDEEMSNMIKFQHAFNAAARNISMVDELLDRIINGLGAGR